MFDLHDSELRALRFERSTNRLQVVFAYVTTFYDDVSRPSETVAAAIVAEAIRSLTVFQLRDPEIVHHAHFLQAGQLVDVNALIDGQTVDDAEIRIFPFAEVAFSAREVRVLVGNQESAVLQAESQRRESAASSDVAAFALPRSWPEFSELHSVAMAARSDGRDEVVVVLRERSTPDATVSGRYLEFHGVGIDLLTAYRLRPPYQITDVLLEMSGRPTSVEQIGDGFVESVNVYFGFGPSSMLEWRPRRLAVRVVDDPAELLDLGGSM